MWKLEHWNILDRCHALSYWVKFICFFFPSFPLVWMTTNISSPSTSILLLALPRVSSVNDDEFKWKQTTITKKSAWLLKMETDQEFELQISRKELNPCDRQIWLWFGTIAHGDLFPGAIPSSSNLLSEIFLFLDRHRMLYCSLHDSDGSILLRFMIADTLTNYSNFRLWHRWLYSQTSNYKIHRWYNRVFFLFFLSLPENI